MALRGRGQSIWLGMTPTKAEYDQLFDELIEVKLALVRVKKDRDKYREQVGDQSKMIFRLRQQISEFREKCDPHEIHVLVTPDELAS